MELTLSELQKLKNSSPPPRHVGDIRMFRVFPKVGATFFHEFWQNKEPDLSMEAGQMVGVITQDGIQWKIECDVIL